MVRPPPPTLLSLLPLEKHKVRRGIYRCACGRVFEGRAIKSEMGKRPASCGCYKRGGPRKTFAASHGESRAAVGGETREYRIWNGIKTRCYNPKNKMFALYGARGIRMCDRWADSYAAFLEDMGRSPSAKHSVDRINYNGDYEPSNCRWATPMEQGANRRNNVLVEIGGTAKTLAQARRETGMSKTAMKAKIACGQIKLLSRSL